MKMNKLWIALGILAIIGMLNSVILLDIRYGFLSGSTSHEGENVFCGEGGGCDLVNASDYSSIFGSVPNAVIGLVGYLILVVLIFFHKLFKLTFMKANTVVSVLVLGAFLLSYAGLYVQKYLIGAYCKYCVFNDFLILIMLVIVSVNMYRLHKKAVLEHLF